MNTKKNEEINLIDLQLISSITFILASLVSLSITYNEKLKLTDKQKFYTNKQSLNISFYNRIVILIAVLISLYVGYNNYNKEKPHSTSKYKNGLLFGTNILTVIGALIILYVSYLNKTEQSVTPSDIENPLI